MASQEIKSLKGHQFKNIYRYDYVMKVLIVSTSVYIFNISCFCLKQKYWNCNMYVSSKQM